jgi:uncharacterized transporter YbjL
MGTTGWKLLLLGAGTTLFTTTLSLLFLRYFARATVIQAMGSTAGMQTLGATAAVGYDLTQSNESYIGYTITFPISVIGKIFLAQVIFLVGHKFF